MATVINKSKTVSDKVIESFLESISAEEGFKEIGARLRETMLAKQAVSEKSLRKAIFDEDDDK